ncbi:Hypothetical protein FKW44_021832, partial [Caligus rogercresseyi]
APNSRPLSSLKESHPSSSKGVLSFVFEKGVPSLVFNFPSLVLVRGVIFLVFMKGPSYHHLFHIEDLFLLVEFANELISPVFLLKKPHDLLMTLAP